MKTQSFEKLRDSFKSRLITMDRGCSRRCSSYTTHSWSRAGRTGRRTAHATQLYIMFHLLQHDREKKDEDIDTTLVSVC